MDKTRHLVTALTVTPLTLNSNGAPGWKGADASGLLVQHRVNLIRADNWLDISVTKGQRLRKERI